MDTVFLDPALVGLQGKRSPMSRYPNPFVKCEFASSLLKVRRVSR